MPLTPTPTRPTAAQLTPARLRPARLADATSRTRNHSGWDGVVGAIPGWGDAVGVGLSLLVIARGVLLGARRWTIARMVVVASTATVVGLIPFVGWAFGFVFKADERNRRTLERHAIDRARTERQSRRVVLVTLAVATLFVMALVFAAVAAVVWLIAQVG